MLFGSVKVIFSFPLVLSSPSTSPHLLRNDFLIPFLLPFVQHHSGIHFSLLDMFLFCLHYPLGNHLIQFTKKKEKRKIAK